jgi:hypothetical protein
MSLLEIAGLVGSVVAAAAFLLVVRRKKAPGAEADLLEIWRVAFDSSPIAMLIGRMAFTFIAMMRAFTSWAPETRRR